MSDLRPAYEAARSSAAGDDAMSVLKRASLDALASSMPGLVPEPAQPALYLRLAEIGGDGHAVPMQQAGDFLERLQRAVARLAKGRRTRVLEVRRLRLEDLKIARLDVLAASPGSLIVKVQPHLEAQADDEVPLGGTTWAEIALTDLLSALPEDDADSGALDGIAAASPVLRRAVADLVLGRKGELLDVSFDFQRVRGERITSRLTPNQSIALRRTLSAPTTERFLETRVGVLDGMRTRRRLFYFGNEDEPEIHGLIDEELLPAVRENLDRRVEVVLEVVSTRSKAGQRSQRSYRLIAVQPAEAEPLPPA